ncbi:MAG: rRNA maturation RNase YbeY [Elusimicrobiota bacterium]|nr:rRNA maturation RNase YbeY [Elusimicrobiota bacterium]
MEFFNEVPANGLNTQKLKNFSSRAVKNLNLQTSVNIILTGVRRIRELNSRFFSKTGITDVIAFNLSAAGYPCPEKLCEVYVCLPAARKAAPRFGHSVGAELRILIAHGLLHLSGMRDDSSAAKKKMLDAGDALVAKLER